MISFAWPWVLVVLPLALVARLTLRPTSADQQASLVVPFYEDLQRFQRDQQKRPTQRYLIWLASIAWIFLVLAAARPQWLGDLATPPVSGRDIMLAVDLSASMEASDFALNGRNVNRLAATKAVAGEFISRREGDRIGLLLFGRQAYLQAPLTFDRDTVQTLLYEAVIGLAGVETAIGDVIGLAVKRFRESRDENQDGDRVLVLLTDGANTAGVIEPLRAAQLAAQDDLKIYTIGIGADEIEVNSLFGRRKIRPSADLDEDTLRAIADITGGQYFRARDTAELEDIYSILDELEPVVEDSQGFRPRRALFPWFLGAATILGLPILLRFLGFGLGQRV
ncbi:MAG: VWA domain-containing protein [Pseudomonadota bacterium]